MTDPRDPRLAVWQKNLTDWREFLNNPNTRTALSEKFPNGIGSLERMLADGLLTDLEITDLRFHQYQAQACIRAVASPKLYEDPNDIFIEYGFFLKPGEFNAYGEEFNEHQSQILDSKGTNIHLQLYRPGYDLKNNPPRSLNDQFGACPFGD